MSLGHEAEAFDAVAIKCQCRGLGFEAGPRVEHQLSAANREVVVVLDRDAMKKFEVRLLLLSDTQVAHVVLLRRPYHSHPMAGGNCRRDLQQRLIFVAETVASPQQRCDPGRQTAQMENVGRSLEFEVVDLEVAAWQ